MPTRREGEKKLRSTDHGILRARPGRLRRATQPGLHPLLLGEKRDGLLLIPESYRSDKPAPLVVTLHGAGGNAHDALNPLRHLAEERGLVLLAPASRGLTWDVIEGKLGPDVDFLDHALAKAFQCCSIDPKRVAIEGFSDGASYALSLGITNAELFTHVLAFSPGFSAPPGPRGNPRIFVSHGKSDEILPVVRCAHRIVRLLESQQYDVTYTEFDGGHSVPREIARAAVDWFTGVERRKTSS